MRKYFVLFICTLSISFYAHAQNYIRADNNISNTFLQDQLEQQYHRQGSNDLVFSCKPFLLVPGDNQYDSLIGNVFELSGHKPPANFINNTFRNGNMLQYISEDSIARIAFNPLYDFSVGRAMGKSIYEHTVGFKLDIRVGKKVIVSTSDYESTVKFPGYIQQYVDSLKVVPGMGTARKNANGSVNFALPLARVAYRPNKTFYFELGNDKNFIGSGHRSLLLSDMAYAYPYFKIVTDLGSIKYMNIWAQFIDRSSGTNPLPGAGFDKKYGAFNYLTFTGIRKLQLSLFQAVIWRNRDSVGNPRDQEWGYFLPVIYLNTFNFNNGSPDNSVMGFDGNYMVGKQTMVYSQLVIDDLNFSELFKNGGFSGYFQEKYGIQLGIKAYAPLGLKNGFIQAEFNTVRPYVYDNKIPAINYTNDDEALADPLGANFREFLLLASYKYKRFLFEGELMYANMGSDSANSDFGQNINKSDYVAPMGVFSYGNRTGQGVKTDLLYATFKASLLMNPATNSRLTLGLLYRKETFQNAGANLDQMVYIGFSTNLINKTVDF
jgi:hypothetical protein